MTPRGYLITDIFEFSSKRGKLKACITMIFFLPMKLFSTKSAAGFTYSPASASTASRVGSVAVSQLMLYAADNVVEPEGGLLYSYSPSQPRSLGKMDCSSRTT